MVGGPVFGGAVVGEVVVEVDPGWVVEVVVDPPAGATVVEVVEVEAGPATLGGVARPGNGAPAISPAPVADAAPVRGTPGAGGSLGMGRMPSSWRASRAIVAKVGAEAAAP